MTGDAKVHRALGPELITIVLAMGVMAEGTSADHRPMAIFTGQPPLFAYMAGEADVIDIALWKTNPPGFNGLLMAGKA